MNEFVAVTSTNIAKILNIYPKKGAILVGADADLVIFDPAATKTISAKTQKSVIEYNVFEGIELTGLPVMTFSRGRLAYKEGDVRAEKGNGRFVERPASAPAAKALSTWKELTAPRRIERTGIPASGV